MKGVRGKKEEPYPLTFLPLPQCPMPNAQCPIPNLHETAWLAILVDLAKFLAPD
jgi:hypothetical protein